MIFPFFTMSFCCLTSSLCHWSERSFGLSFGRKISSLKREGWFNLNQGSMVPQLRRSAFCHFSDQNDKIICDNLSFSCSSSLNRYVWDQHGSAGCWIAAVEWQCGSSYPHVLCLRARVQRQDQCVTSLRFRCFSRSRFKVCAGKGTQTPSSMTSRSVLKTQIRYISQCMHMIHTLARLQQVATILHILIYYIVRRMTRCFAILSYTELFSWAFGHQASECEQSCIQHPRLLSGADGFWWRGFYLSKSIESQKSFWFRFQAKWFIKSQKTTMFNIDNDEDGPGFHQSYIQSGTKLTLGRMFKETVCHCVFGCILSEWVCSPKWRVR